MKTIIFLIILVLAGMISNNKQFAQHKKGEVVANQVSLRNEITPAGKPKILFMLQNETGLAAWSPAFWWSDQHTNPARPGC